MAIWRRRKRSDPEIEVARRRLEEAQRDLKAAKDDSRKVDEVARDMHAIRKANRFAAMMREALRGTE